MICKKKGMVMVKIQKVTPDLSIKRSVDSGTEEQLRAVKDIIAKVKKEGDKALRELTARFDGAELDSFAVTEEEIREALRKTG